MKEFYNNIEIFNKYLSQVYNKILPFNCNLKLLSEPILYSLNSGGKRYRPLLVLATADFLELKYEEVLPLAAAIESIHTYSLIHDDMPCMDNDDYRRGQLSNHKKFGEDLALLSGDALISEALAILVENYHGHKEFKKLFLEFTRSIGINGMIGGQVLDLKLPRPNQDDMSRIHLLKTGQLIKLSIKGVGHLAQLNEADLTELENISFRLGHAFQLQDDLHDFTEQPNTEEANMVSLLGLEVVKRKVKELTEEIFIKLNSFTGNSENLKKLINYNLNRDI